MQGMVCRSYYLGAECGMQELLHECRVWYAGAYPSAGCGMQELTRVHGVVAYPSAGCGMQELLPECRVWYAGEITRVPSMVCRSYYPSAGYGMQDLTRVQGVV